MTMLLFVSPLIQRIFLLKVCIIQTSFGILPKKSRDERQVVLATGAVTSLVTYFTTRQLVQMGSDEDSDELIGTTNHLIAAIEDHETRITRIEERQKQSDKVVDKLTDSLVLRLLTEDLFLPFIAYLLMLQKWHSISKMSTLDHFLYLQAIDFIQIW